MNRTVLIPIFIAVIFFAFFLAADSGEKSVKETLIQGKTMGTTFHITVAARKPLVDLEKRIHERLREISRSMSTYDPESEISRFNALSDTEREFPISGDFLTVMTTACRLYEITKGAWDGTVDPLINLWGFGRVKKTPEVPPSSEIASLLRQVGFDRIRLDPGGFLRKKHPKVTLDLASVAKGYGVDAVSRLIAERGFENYLVEIGGEVYASGFRPDGGRWRIGINRPKTDAAFNDVYRVVSLKNRGFATSGDYRNFFIQEGKRYSHVIDPRTGYAVSNGVVSASVIADTCALADGLATAFMVMGPEAGVALADRLDNVECLIIVETSDGDLISRHSKGFRLDG